MTRSLAQKALTAQWTAQTKVCRSVDEAWWWELVLSLGDVGVPASRVPAMERHDRRCIHKLREFAFGVTDLLAVPEGMRQGGSVARAVLLQRYALVGSRLDGFFETALREDGSID